MHLQIAQICMLVFIIAAAGLAAFLADDWAAARYAEENGQPPVRGTRKWSQWRTDYWVDIFSRRQTWLCAMTALFTGVMLPSVAMIQIGAKSSAIAGVSLFSAAVCILLFAFWVLFTVGPTGFNLLVDQILQGKRPNGR